jgi:hypothetical protein
MYENNTEHELREQKKDVPSETPFLTFYQLKAGREGFEPPRSG